MKKLIVLLPLLLALPAQAKDITLTLNEQEQKTFMALLDSALKQGGLANLQAVTQFVQKYQTARLPDGPVAAPDIKPIPFTQDSGAKKDAPDASAPAGR